MSRRGRKRAPALGRKVKPGPITHLTPARSRHVWPEWTPGTLVPPGPMIPFTENPAAAGHMLKNILSPDIPPGQPYTHVFTTPADAVDDE